MAVSICETNQLLFAFGLFLFLALFDPFSYFIWRFYTCVLWQAHYMLGLALLQRKDYADGVKALQKGNWVLSLSLQCIR